MDFPRRSVRSTSARTGSRGMKLIGCVYYRVSRQPMRSDSWRICKRPGASSPSENPSPLKTGGIKYRMINIGAGHFGCKFYANSTMSCSYSRSWSICW